MSKIRAIAMYLPQYHPIPENDEWWERGFTEWTNVTKAKPLFKGHYQPDLPSELGFYDLRLPEVREAQAQMAGEYGIEGFMYWHYWFNGKRILERPFKEVLESGKPDFPFCLGWANETWSGIWHGSPNKILIEQTYPGKNDYVSHFNVVLRALKDTRYILVDGKPLFFVYKPFSIPDCSVFLGTWQKLAKENGLKGIYFVAFSGNPEQDYQTLLDLGFDAIFSQRMDYAIQQVVNKGYMHKIKAKLYRKGIPVKYTEKGIYEYKELIKHLTQPLDKVDNVFPMLLPNWDNSPRSGKRSMIIQDSNPELFRQHVRTVLEAVEEKPKDNRIVFVKSWNEWAEGNYLEPSRRYGRLYLDVLRDELLGD